MKKPIILSLLIVCIVALSILVVAAVSLISEQEAVSIAQTQVKGTVQEVELETHNDKQVYEVEVVNGETENDVIVDAQSGEVLAVEEETEGEDVPITGSALDKAKAAALKVVCEGKSSCDARVTDTEVGDEESYYEVEVKYNGKEIDVQLDEDFNFVGYD